MGTIQRVVPNGAHATELISRPSLILRIFAWIELAAPNAECALGHPGFAWCCNSPVAEGSEACNAPLVDPPQLGAATDAGGNFVALPGVIQLQEQDSELSACRHVGAQVTWVQRFDRSPGARDYNDRKPAPAWHAEGMDGIDSPTDEECTEGAIQDESSRTGLQPEAGKEAPRNATLDAGNQGLICSGAVLKYPPF